MHRDDQRWKSLPLLGTKRGQGEQARCQFIDSQVHVLTLLPVVRYSWPVPTRCPFHVRQLQRSHLLISNPNLSIVQHDIVPNGYNLGRDYIVGNVTGSAIPTLTLTNESTYSGSTSYGGYTYKTDVSYASGMLQNTSIGINHNITVLIDGVTNAVDGLVAVLQVTITARPQSDQYVLALCFSAITCC